MVAHHTDMQEVTIAFAKEKLQAHPPQKSDERHETKRSAVTMLLHEVDGQLCVLMIERAKREGDPWSGHMAFPGGRVDPTDAHSYDAAVRECEEEIGLTITDHGGIIGRLSDLPTHWRKGILEAMWVTPFVFELKTVPELQPNYEVADTVWIPLSFLADSNNREVMHWSNDEVSFDLPCYYYQQKKVWGLSLAMLDELLAALDLANFPKRGVE